VRFAVLGLALALGLRAAVAADAAAMVGLIDTQIAAHPNQTGAFVLEKGADALVARAWLADQARESIDVQYFIWSTDNIGILATEALLRAAERGVMVRVIIDDVLMNAPDDMLLALAEHPRIDIRIYNPNLSAGVSWPRKLLNAITDFRAVNQRMHDKTFVVDRKLAITGGRNMAVEYFDYHHEFNFRDRDVLLVGQAAGAVSDSFERFWTSSLAAPVEDIYDSGKLDGTFVRQLYANLHEYARKPENFAPIVHSAIEAVADNIPKLIGALSWGSVEFISDEPGKNLGGLEGGGRTSAILAGLVASARQSILIESPYLVLSDRALEVFRQARERGVRVAICTNSLASTDNLPAFSGYRQQRQKLFDMGIEVYEARPDAQVQTELMQRAPPLPPKPPKFTLHAKTMVIDGKAAFIGTFNLDPRSENLNTEVGAILHDPAVAAGVAQAIETDMAPGNSWNAKTDRPDQYASLRKRFVVWLLELLPLRPIL
jgi:putative cardiolipin synthase